MLRKSVYKMISKVLRNIFYSIKIMRVSLSDIINVDLLIPISKGQSVIIPQTRVLLRLLETKIDYKIKMTHIVLKSLHVFRFKT